MSRIMTVCGEIPAEELGRTLVHEHVLCDFIGAEQTGPHRWNPDEVLTAILPNLKALKARGFHAFVDCTPAYIGRDVRLLRRLSEASGLHILTNTGFYKEPFLPKRAFTLDADALSDEWTREFEEGIEGTDIRPGFIKIAVNPGPLLEVQKKIVRAAARTSKRTGLVIACHTGHGGAAFETIALLQEENLPLDRYICVHADSEPDREIHRALALAGGWVEYDAIGWRPFSYHVELVAWALRAGVGGRLLLSQDSGWYYAGEPNGGNIRPYTYLHDEFLPQAVAAGIPREYLETVLTTHAQSAFAYD